MRTIFSLLLLLSALALPASAQEAALQNADYQAMEFLLDNYKVLAATGGWPSLAPSTKKITPGSSDARIDVIRDILTKMGDYNGAYADKKDHYDEALQAAVKLFQERHGLTDDGVIGKTTLAALAVPVDERIVQIEATMKRMQELPIDLGKKFIIVNLPEYRLRGFDNGEQMIDMRVVIGAPATSTPIFSNQITYVTFNPQWGVPTKITKKELLPKILEDPNYLQEHDYAIYDVGSGDKEEVLPDKVDWDAAKKGKFPYQIRQRAGKKNALGKIKFGMVGTDDIYLHDTASPSFFAKDERDLSHGCIRVEHPHELAQFIFKDNEKIPSDKMEELYKDDDTKTVRVTAVPVHLVYWTAWVDPATNRANFRKDIYGLDKN